MHEEIDLEALREALVTWFDHQQRSMPWRETQDPYAIWLSEIMLQQTRVETVRPYYARFLEAFPTIEALADAPIDEVLAQWSGLGYYRRARHLHAAAQSIQDDFGGEFPSRYEDILSLKGVGRYTAGAISSIAFGLPRAAVDGNVHRVMSRLFSIEEALGSPRLDKESWSWASQLVEGERPGDFNQALMELGATVCTPRNPTCMLCPVRQWCSAYAHGDESRLPLPKQRKAPKEVQVVWALLRRSGKILLVQRPPTGLFAGMWEFPGLYLEASQPEGLALLAEHIEGLGLTARFGETPALASHTLSHRRLQISLYQGRAVKGRIALPRSSWKWVDPDDLPELAMSSIIRQLLTGL